LLSPSRQEGGLSSQSRHQGGCHHQVDRMGIVITKSTRGRHTVDQRGCHHQVDQRSSHSRPTGLSSPSRQKVVTQSINGVAVTKSAQRGCRRQVDKRSSHSRPKERGLQVNPVAGIPSQPRSGDTKSAHERGHQVNSKSGDTKSTLGAGTPSQPKKRGHQVNPRKKRRGHQVNPRREGGDTNSTHGEREGTPSQPTEKGRGHHVNPRKSQMAYQLID